MGGILTVLTYAAYIFIIVMYARKAVRYARMPPPFKVGSLSSDA
jgi:hypothetical protein